MNSSVIHASGRDGLAHARMMSTKHVSTRTAYCLALCRIDRVTRRLSSGTMPRGSGDHQPHRCLPPGSSIGKMPCRYAVINVAGSRSPPVAMTSPSGQTEDGGNDHGLSPTACGRDGQSVTALTYLVS